MLSASENDLLTQVGPGTAGGELLRRYWHPICGTEDLDKRPLRTYEFKLLGEELVVYRDRSGNLGVVDKYCSHRRASLAYGIVESDGIRCQYHGWKFNAEGECVEQPFEDTVQPSGRFREKCPIQAYKAQELGGLIFIYMGPGPAPLLPNWGILTWAETVRDIAITRLPCNWLQAQENSLDSIHTEHLHDYASRYFTQVLAGQEPDFKRARSHLDIDFDEFEHGIIKRRETTEHGKDHPQWTDGHAILFPNILWVGGGTMQWRVPADDTHTTHITLYAWRAAPGAKAPVQDVVPSREVQLVDSDGTFRDLQVLFNQDYMCWATQGEIANRELEQLGRSDKGIQLFRKVLRDEIERVRMGEEPSMNIFRDSADNQGLEWPRIPFEHRELAGAPFRPRDGVFRYVPAESGYSRDAKKIEAAMATWEEFFRARANEDSQALTPAR